MAVAQSADRSAEISDRDYKAITDLIYSISGIVTGESKRAMVMRRLSHRLRALGLKSVRDYVAYLDGPERVAEIARLIDAVTTNHTKFYRERHHFDHLRDVAVAAWAKDSVRLGRRLRIWSAGCSTGDEPYSIAMTIAAALPSPQSWDWRILATDIDSQVLAKARAGVYDESSLEDVPRALTARFAQSEGPGKMAVCGAARDAVAFKRLNLLEPWPMKGPFDAIFCRNVVIYFDMPTKIALVERFIEMLRPGGWLYVGHSESFVNSIRSVRPLGQTIYQKIERSAR